MADLGIPRNTIEVLQRHHFTFQKKYGQNFLIDPNVLDRVVRAADITAEDCVLEIGPGIGTMTQRLAERAGKVAAVEIDRNLIPILEETLAPYPNVTIINEDILKLDLRQLAEEMWEGRPMKVVANLPYYITTPIVMGLLEGEALLHSITVMVQREVALRLAAKPGSKDYGALSVYMQLYTQPEVLFDVPPECFLPAPKVTSSVIRCRVRETPAVSARCGEDFFFQVVKGAFALRRKTLCNSLGTVFGSRLGKEGIAQAVSQCGLPPAVRGEALGLEEFAALADCLWTAMKGGR